MDIASAFTFMFDDEDWMKKMVIGALAMLLSIVVVPILAVYGYMIELIRNVSRNEEKPLPQWENLGALIMQGLMVTVIGLVYYIPVILFACFMAIPPILMQEAGSDMADSLAIVSTCLSLVMSLLSLVISLILPAAIIRYAIHDKLSAAFQFGAVFRFITSHPGDYIIALLVSGVASVIAIFGLLLCLIGVYFTNFWAITVMGNMLGQLARKMESEPILV